MMKTTLHRNPAAIAIRIFFLLFLIDTAYALIILAFLGLAPPAEYYSGFVILLWAAHTAKYIVTTFLLLRILLEWMGQTYSADDKHLTIRTGVYAISEKVYELTQLKRVKVRQDWLGRLFHFGNLTLEISASGFHETIELRDIADPRKYERELVQEFV